MLSHLTSCSILQSFQFLSLNLFFYVYFSFLNLLFSSFFCLKEMTHFVFFHQLFIFYTFTLTGEFFFFIQSCSYLQQSIRNFTNLKLRIFYFSHEIHIEVFFLFLIKCGQRLIFFFSKMKVFFYSIFSLVFF